MFYRVVSSVRKGVKAGGGFKERDKQGFSVLAPMEDVTDLALRRVFVDFGLMPHVFFTEFTNVEGIATRKMQVLHRITPDEITMGFPTIAQLWGSDERKFYNAVFLVLYLGFWGVDLNMGCPVKKVIKKGLGAGLIKPENHGKAQSLVNIAKQAVNDFWANEKLRKHWQGLVFSRLKNAISYLDDVYTRVADFDLPEATKQSIAQNVLSKQEYLQKLYNNKALLKPTVSIKTRLSVVPDEDDVGGLAQQQSRGDSHNNDSLTDPWLEKIFSWGVDFITVHLQTTEEMSKVPAHYERIAYINSLAQRAQTPWVVNGDILSIQQGNDLIDKQNSVGFMVGRGIFRNPLIFTGYNPKHEFNCQGLNETSFQDCIRTKRWLQTVYEGQQRLFKTLFERHSLVARWEKFIQDYNAQVNRMKNERESQARKDFTNGASYLPEPVEIYTKSRGKHEFIKSQQMLMKFRKMYKVKKAF